MGELGNKGETREMLASVLLSFWLKTELTTVGEFLLQYLQIALMNSRKSISKPR